MRRPSYRVFLTIAIMAAMLGQGCTTVVPGPTAVEPPVTPPAVPGNEDAPPSTTLPPAVADTIEKRLGDGYVLGHWMAAEDGYYLVEIDFVPTGEHGYEWVSSGGIETDFFGFMERTSFVDFKDGTYRFLCTMVGDCLGVFPYYLAGKPGETPKTVPFFKVPNADTYGISGSGLAYELKKVGPADSLDLLFAITGPEPGGVMAGGARPPTARIIESEHSVMLRFLDVSLAPGTEQAIRGFSSDAARLKSVSCEDGCLELEFDVPWAYSVSLAREKAEQASGILDETLLGYRIGFLSRPGTGDAVTSLHDTLATATGLRVGDSTVTAPLLFGEMQEHLLRAFPLRQAPSGASGRTGVGMALRVNERWLEEKGAYYAGGQDGPSYLKWRDRWYEVTSAFDALLETAALPARDSLGATPDSVVRRYLLAVYNRDWKSAYACLSSDHGGLSLQEFVKRAEAARKSGIYHRVEGFEGQGVDVASVSMSAERRNSRVEPSRWRESWTCLRENGVWRLVLPEGNGT